MDWRHQAACRDHDPELWFTVVALSYGGAIRKCMRRVAMMCAKHSACEQLDRQEARA